MDAVQVLDRDGTVAPRSGGGPEEGVAVVALHEGCLRQGVGALRRTLGEALDSGCSTLVVDVSGVEHLSSVVVALLLRAKRCCRVRGGRVVLRGLGRDDLDVLHRTGLAPLFDIEPATR